MNENPNRSRYDRRIVTLVVIAVVVWLAVMLMASRDIIAGFLRLTYPHIVESCERMLNEQQGIRIEEWDTSWANYESRYFQTLDGGNTWTQVFDIFRDSSVHKANCAEIPVVDGTLFYIRSYRELLVADPSAHYVVDADGLAAQVKASCEFEEVAFQTRKNGSVLIECYFYGTREPNSPESLQLMFNTLDGGATWQKVSETPS